IPLILGPQLPEAREVIEARARELNIPVFPSTGTPLPFPPPFRGKHQVDNCKTAILALERLGVDPSGVQNALWPGRLELIATQPDIYLDGAHNPAGAAAVAEFI